MLAVLLCLVPLSAAGLWAWWRQDQLPVALVDLAAFGVLLVAFLVEGRIVDRLWAGTMSAARPFRLTLGLSRLLVGLATCERVVRAWPFAVDDVTSLAGLARASDIIESNAETFLYYLAIAVSAAVAVLHGGRTAFGQAAGLLFDAAGGAGRRRAKSNLHGAARFMTRREMRRLGEPASPNTIILGAEPGRFGGRLVTYDLRGSVTTLAPPRTGKTTLVILNLLDPGRIGWRGSTVTMDPRGNVFAVTARRRLDCGRDVKLVDPFGLVQRYRASLGAAVDLPDVATVTLNPLDLVRLDENHSSDIQALLRVILSNPDGSANKNAEHFFNLCLNVLTGMISWIRHHNPPELQTLAEAHRLCGSSGEQLARLREAVAESGSPGRRFTELGLEALARVSSTDEGASTFTSLLNQLAFVYNEQVGANIQRSSFDPAVLADGNVDFYIVVPQEHFEVAAPWIRLWMALPGIIANRVGKGGLKHDILVFLDEMPSLGYIDPVMKSFNMAAGQGVHYWCIAQTASALDKTYGEANRRIIFENAEVLQAIGFSPFAPKFGEEFSKAVGSATFHNRNESRSASSRAGPGLSAGSQDQAGISDGLVKEAIILADELMRLPEDEQVVITSTRKVSRNAMRIRHARYWRRKDCRGLFAPDPLELGDAARRLAVRP